jgi:hypothetical protein
VRWPIAITATTISEPATVTSVWEWALSDLGVYGTESGLVQGLKMKEEGIRRARIEGGCTELLRFGAVALRERFKFVFDLVSSHKAVEHGRRVR